MNTTEVQDTFLAAAIEQKTRISIFLLTGIRLTGVVVASDKFCFLLENGDITQLVYKHAVATVCPGGK